MTLVQAETGEVVVLMDRDEAEKITAKIKSYAGVLYQLLGEAHDRQAWRALGYASWRAYVAAEFDMGKSHAYRLVSQARIVAELEDAAGIAEVSPMGDSQPLVTEREARDLAPHIEQAKAEVADAVADLPADDTAERTRRTAEVVTNLRDRITKAQARKTVDDEAAAYAADMNARSAANPNPERSRRLEAGLAAITAAQDAATYLRRMTQTSAADVAWMLDNHNPDLAAAARTRLHHALVAIDEAHAWKAGL